MFCLSVPTAGHHKARLLSAILGSSGTDRSSIPWEFRRDSIVFEGETRSDLASLFSINNCGTTAQVKSCTPLNGLCPMNLIGSVLFRHFDAYI